MSGYIQECRGVFLGSQRNTLVFESLKGLWKKIMYESKQWNKMSFGNIEVFLEVRNVKFREVD